MYVARLLKIISLHNSLEERLYSFEKMNKIECSAIDTLKIRNCSY